MPCQNLSDLSDAQFRAFLSSFDSVMFDCDGVIWTASGPIGGAVDAVRMLRRLGKKVFFCTNNSTKTRQEYVEKLGKLGFGGQLDEVYGASFLTAAYLKDQDFKGKVYVIGTTGITQELENMGIEHVMDGVGPDLLPADWSFSQAEALTSSLSQDLKCVIVGYDHHISYPKILKAATILHRPDTLFVATNTDEQFPFSETCIIPGTGAVVGAVAKAAERSPIVMGKPSKLMFEAIQKRHPNIDPKRTLMVGDRANTDILLGKNCNLQTLMVGTGVHSLQDVRRWEASEDADDRKLAADFFADRLGDLGDRQRLLEEEEAN